MLLSIIWWGAAVGGVLAVVAAVITTESTRRPLFTAAGLFLIAGVLGILSIGIGFLIAAAVCVVLAVRAPGYA